MEAKTPLVTSRHAVLLFFTSASVLAYEILLMRLLSISFWHHFSYMVISLALLGFGAAGSFLFLLSKRVYRNIDAWLVLLAGGASLSFPLAFSLAREISLDPLNLVWQWREWLKMLATYLVMAIPFLLSGGIVGIILSAAGREVPRLYAADLLGAGFGSMAVIPALYLAPPWTLLPLLSGALLVSAGWCCWRTVWGGKGILVLPVTGTLILACYVLLPPVAHMHHTKALPMTMNFPDARLEAQRDGPLGLLHVVGSSLIREVPGLSLTYGLDGKGEEGILPNQKEIFSDGDALSTITRFSGDPDELEHLDFTTMALPYHVRRPKKILVVGAGGGSDVLLALKENASSITALESNPQVAEWMTGPFADFSGHLYSKPGVRLLIREARQFLHGTEERFDLIQLSLLDSFGGSSAGLYSAAESYLYTTEALGLYLRRLSDSGILAVTRWLKMPPRDSLRIFSTALTALREAGTSPQPEEHLLLIRSWKTSTLLVSRSPFAAGEIEKAAAFCDRRSFDVDYYAGIKEERTNRYDIQKEAYSFRGATSLAGPQSKRFLKEYLFDVTPTTDDKPYFSHFFRWDKAWTLFQQLRREFLPFVEIGYVLILATLVQAVVAGGALILLPLIGLRRDREWAQGGFSAWAVLGTLFYFCSIGFAFMFLEMAFLPKYTLLLAHPIYSTAMVLGAVLVFAGLGSLSVGHLESRSLWIAVACVCAWVLIQALIEETLLGWALGWPFGARLVLTVVMVGSVSFFLGWPFPIGLRETSARFSALVPWAWGVNACASVIGAVLGKMISMSVGLRMTMVVAALLYVFAAPLFRLALQPKRDAG
ncbi:MAG: SAM-dependent methyltransferase [Desulfobacterota bacterium]|nr:SAM-dependent methyltransferase [Thermodesulfobacteriota bacterium]